MYQNKVNDDVRQSTIEPSDNMQTNIGSVHFHANAINTNP